MTALDHALHYAGRGWRVIPIPPGHKHPHGMNDWPRRATADTERVRSWWTKHPDHGVGIVTGVASGLVVIDVDAYKPGASDAWDALVEANGGVPDTVEAITGRGGRHLFFAHPADGPAITNASHTMPLGVDVRGEGGFVVAAPTIHPETSRPYAWEVEHDPLDGVAVAPMPLWLVALLRAPVPAQVARRDRPVYAGVDSIVARFDADHTWPELLEAEGWQLHSVRSDHELWTRPGKELRDGASASLYWAGSDSLTVFSTSAAPLAANTSYSRFGFWAACHHGGDHHAAASAYRRHLNATMIDRTRATMTDTSIDHLAAEATPGTQPHTDLGNARRLVADHGHDLRHAPQLGSWLTWDGCRWAEDMTGEVHRRAKSVVDGMLTEMAVIADHEVRRKLFGHWMRSQANARIEAMISLARTEPGVPVLVAALDADPWKINTTSGVVDLRTGAVEPAERHSLVTKLAPVELDLTATCPQWEAFIDWAMQGDAELIEFVRRAVGYTLSGVVTEQVLFFLHGHGENGKSTFLNVLQALLGDYSIAAEPDLLLATTHDKHTTGIADLVGRRLVVVQETEEGRRFAESTVKQLTGGDMVRARRMRQDFFQFRPTHKLWMAANHRPNVRGTDHAIWRRIRMIPFTAALAPGQRDEHLADRLLAELPGILCWALRGCAAWLEHGLQPPSAVQVATAEYRIEQDHVGRFIEDCCIIDPDVCVAARDLRQTYERWCEENGERAWSAKAMAPQLTERGCDRVKVGRENVSTWIGITLVDTPRPIDAAVAMGRVGRRSGFAATHATHSQWVAAKNCLPADSETATHRDPSPVYPRSDPPTSGGYGGRVAMGRGPTDPLEEDLF